MAQTPRPGADAGISVGQIFLGKYRVEAILGQGGMGVVARCTHLGLNEQVAMKMLRQDVLLDRDATERFMREAQAASKLRSEHVARVVDVGTFHDTGVPYMVMEFLDGYDLDQLLEERGTIPPPWGSMLMLQAAEALAEAHSIGIVHRDVKPSNLFVTWRPDGTAIVKVLDFGISKAPVGTDMQLTQTQSLLGTPAYMSPEQMRSARLVDARTDIWSLGTVFYELLEGRRPFEADSFSEMCVKVAVDPPEPMTNTPPALQQVVLRCLAKSPDQRYANMAELGRDLIPFVQDVHQASLLVERMQRVLGRQRTTEGWEGVQTASGAIPRPARDIASAPVRARTPMPMQRVQTPLPMHDPWQADSNASITPHPGTVEPPNTIRDSAPAQAPSELTATVRTRRWPWVVLLFAAIAAGLVVVMWKVAGEPMPAAEQHVATPPPAEPPIVKSAVVDPPKVDGPKTDGTKTDDPKTDGSKTDGTHPAAGTKQDETIAKTPEIVKQPPKRSPTRPPIRTVRDPKKDPKKEPKEVKKDPPVEPPQPPCPIEDRLPSGGCAHH